MTFNYELDHKQKRVTITFHGFKRPNRDDFAYLINYGHEKFEHDFVTFYYFKNAHKDTINRKKFDVEIEKMLNKYPGYKITVVAYSLGVAAAVKHAAKDERIDNLMLICPTYKIAFWKWVTVLLNAYNTKRRLKKKLGKERYKNLHQKHKATNSTAATPNIKHQPTVELSPKIKIMDEIPANERSHRNQYPIRLSWNVNLYRKFAKKSLRDLKNKNIYIMYAKEDLVTQHSRNIKIIDKNLNYKANQVKIVWENVTHYNILDKGQFGIFDKIIEFSNTGNVTEK